MKSKFLFLIAGLFSLPFLSYSQENTKSKDLTDREILEIFYNATGGDEWEDNTNWLTEEPLNNWHGISASGEDVFSIYLVANNLVGEIPHEVGGLTYLNQLKLGQNNISGSIPNEIGNLIYLTNLSLDYNQITGEFPSEIWELENLQVLNVNLNSLTGAITSSIGNMNSLETLLFSGNNISGNIPDVFENIGLLERFGFDNNNLTGTIPLSLANLPNLSGLGLYSNKMTGEIPYFASDNIEYFQLGDNNFDKIADSMIYFNVTSYITVQSNLLSFEDVIHLPDNANYIPQKTIPINELITINKNETYTYQLPFDQDVDNSTYNWYKNGQLFETTYMGELVLNAPEESQTDYYHLQISNSDFPDLILNTDSITVISQATGIQDYQTGNEIQIRPNPVYDRLLLSVEKFKNPITEICIYSLKGEKVKSWEINSWSNKSNIELNIADLNKGMYFIKIHSNSQKRVKKFIKH